MDIYILHPASTCAFLFIPEKSKSSSPRSIRQNDFQYRNNFNDYHTEFDYHNNLDWQHELNYQRNFSYHALQADPS